MHILPLDREKYDYFELHYSYTTMGHYKAVVVDSKDCMSYTLTRESYDTPRTEENTDTLFQDYCNYAFTVKESTTACKIT